MRFLNDSDPWWGAVRGPALGIVDLIANETLPAEAAAALWWTIERGASFFVVAGPGSAGKTTLAGALLPFLPEESRLYAIDGAHDPIDVPEPDPPVYLLINELSDHMQRYVHGAAALRAFALLRSGYRVIGTLHADSAAEALTVMQEESGIPLLDAVRVPLLLVLRPENPAHVMGWRLAPDAKRRLVEIGHVQPGEGGASVLAIASWDNAEQRLVTGPPPGGVAALAAWAGVSEPTAAREIAARATALSDLTLAARRDPEALVAAVQERRRAEGFQ